MNHWDVKWSDTMSNIHLSASRRRENAPTRTGKRKSLTRVGFESHRCSVDWAIWLSLSVFICWDIIYTHSLLPSDLVAQSVQQRGSIPEVVGSTSTLVRVFLFPCTPIPRVNFIRNVSSRKYNPCGSKNYYINYYINLILNYYQIIIAPFVFISPLKGIQKRFSGISFHYPMA